jgi:hypothetical protein
MVETENHHRLSKRDLNDNRYLYENLHAEHAALCAEHNLGECSPPCVMIKTAKKGLSYVPMVEAILRDPVTSRLVKSGLW